MGINTVHFRGAFITGFSSMVVDGPEIIGEEITASGFPLYSSAHVDWGSDARRRSAGARIPASIRLSRKPKAFNVGWV